MDKKGDTQPPFLLVKPILVLPVTALIQQPDRLIHLL